MALADQALLAADPTFQSRVKEALAQTCFNIVSEAVTQSNLQLHISRARLAAQILNNLSGGTPNWSQTFAIGVATDATTIAAALAQAGGPLTATNTAAAAASIPDTDISNAISAQFNAYLTLA